MRKVSFLPIIPTQIRIFILLVLAFVFSVSGYALNSSDSTGVFTEIKNAKNLKWGEIANSLQKSTFKIYAGKNGVFKQDNKGKDRFHYWWNAHMVDVLVDGYERTKDKSYLPKIKALVRGIKTSNNNGYQIYFNDDMQWLGIACVRAYEATGDPEYKEVAEYLWKEVKKGWTPVHGGGIMWRTDTPEEKNACSNGPGAQLALKIYDINKNPEDLEWAKKIFEWQKNTLVDPLTGLVWDNISYKDGEAVINKEWVLTYNQGTQIGAALQLYDHTKDQQYLADAWKTTNAIMTSPKTTFEGILRNEGQGDGGLFKGILVRNLALLAENPHLEEAKKEKLLEFLTYNANIVRTFGLDSKEMLVGPNWAEKPTRETDFSTQLSGVMLMEMAARLQLPQKDVSKVCQESSAPRQKLQTPLKKEVVIVVLGSSTAEGMGPIHKENAWVAQFSRHLEKLDPKFTVINLAVGGYETKDIHPNGNPEKNVTKAMSLNPDAIIINLPSNDAAQGRGLAEQLKNYREIMEVIKKDIPVWITTPQPRNFEKFKVDIQKELVDATYAEYKNPYTIDLWTCFANERGSLRPEYDSGDGIHLNDRAHSIIFERVLASQGDFKAYLKNQ